jgi:hypothetical protein
MAVGLGLIAVLLVFSLNAFGGGSSGRVTTANSSILSQSSAENQIKFCAEGRDSSYGNPPSPAQQAKCMNELAKQVSGGGLSVPGAP